MAKPDVVAERGSMSRSSPTAQASPKENFGRSSRRLPLRLVEPRSVDGVLMRLPCV